MSAVKTFYVEAPTRDEACDISEEEAVSSGEFDWEFEDSSAEEVSEERAKYILEKRKHRILEP